MTPWMLVASHALVALLSSALTWYIIMRAAGAPVVPHHDHHERARHMRRPSLTAIAMIALALVIVTYGLSQQLISQDKDRRDATQRACFVRVVDELTQAYTVRSDANVRLQRAVNAKSEALDRIVEAVTTARRSPAADNVKDFDQALDTYAKAKARQRKAQRAYEAVRKTNPAPPTVREACSP